MHFRSTPANEAASGSRTGSESEVRAIVPLNASPNLSKANRAEPTSSREKNTSLTALLDENRVKLAQLVASLNEREVIEAETPCQ